MTASSNLIQELELVLGAEEFLRQLLIEDDEVGFFNIVPMRVTRNDGVREFVWVGKLVVCWSTEVWIHEASIAVKTEHTRIVVSLAFLHH